MCCAFSFVSWGCGGWAMGMWWHGSWLVGGAPEHCTCAVIFACSYVLVALICVIVNFYSRFLGQCMYRTCGSSLLVATSSFWNMAFPRVTGLWLQLLGQLLQGAPTEHTCTLILLRTMICLGRLVIMLFPAVRFGRFKGFFLRPFFGHDFET